MSKSGGQVRQEPTKAYFLIEEFNNKKALKELGYVFDAEKLDDFTARAFIKISSLYNEEEIRQMNQKGKK